MSTEPTIYPVAALVHGRVLVDVPDRERPPLLVGFHGYGEDAAAHLAALRRIPASDGWLRCAVEALHPFYTKAGKVVGSWMTQRDRERAIDDNVRYAAGVVAELRRRYPASTRLVFCGFSQGVAMAYRAAFSSGCACDGVIALAGDVPPEVAARRPGHAPRVLLGRGTEDTWYSESKMAGDQAALASLGASVETCVFEAGHEWDARFIDAADTFLKGVDRPA